MRLDEILEDQQPKHVEQQIKQFAEQVMQDCSLYLKNKSATNNLLRGIGHPQSRIVIDRQLESQRPGGHSDRSAVQALHKLMQADGFKATRMNGYYTSPDINHVRDFGAPYVIFPVGDYSLTWHQPTEDVPEDLGANELIDIGMEVSNTEVETNEQAVESFWKNYKHLFKHGQNVDQAVGTDSEVIVLANTIHAIEYDLYRQFESQLTEYWYNQ